jgi:copper chaperone CopZ
MRFNLFLFASSVFLLACGGVEEAHTTDEVIVEADAKAIFTIEGMVCEAGCASFIDTELEDLSGVASVEVNLDAKTAEIYFDQSILSERDCIDLINSVKDSSYSVSNVEVMLIKQIEKVSIDTH